MNRIRRGAALVAIALAATVTLVGTGATGASAAAAGVRIAPYSNPFLEVEVYGAATGYGADVDQWNFTGGDNQIWSFQPHNGYYWIINRHSGLCLASDGVAGHTVYQWGCGDASPSELWSYNLANTNSDIASTIYNPASGLYLDVRGGSGGNGADIILWYYNGGTNQRFETTRA
jgi:hypothetical protein